MSPEASGRAAAGPARPGSDSWAERLLPGAWALTGLFFGLTLAKWGNPAILDHLNTPPEDFWQFVYFAWPLRWGYALLGLTVAVGLACWRWPGGVPIWLTGLPAGWFLWQCLAAAGTVDGALTGLTLPYLLAGTVCYYHGLMLARHPRGATWLWAGWLAGFLFMLAIGFQQHFGGLEATRQQILSRPDWQTLPPEFIERVNKLRVFATLMYPNSLAEALVLLLPAMTVAVWRLSGFLTRPTRLLLAGLVLAGGLGCLYWSKSKGGWLVALVLAGMVFWRMPMNRRWRLGIGVAVVAGGLAVFAVRFADYFRRGATSVGARFDYWRAACQVVADHPVLGSGPGTFQREYARRKPPEAEMTRLVHNDYLQQASDSGLPGAVLYAALVWGSLAWLARRCWREPMRFAVWLGLAGWALQSFIEFGLYIPPIGWGAFYLLGWLTREAAGDSTGFSAPHFQQAGRSA